MLRKNRWHRVNGTKLAELAKDSDEDARKEVERRKGNLKGGLIPYWEMSTTK